MIRSEQTTSERQHPSVDGFYRTGLSLDRRGGRECLLREGCNARMMGRKPYGASEALSLLENGGSRKGHHAIVVHI